MSTNVDTSLATQPTGRAAQFAQTNSTSNPEDPILYGGWFCPFVQRVWIVMHEKSIRHQYIEINPYKKEPEFLALNPRGLVPTLAVPVPSSLQGQNQRKPLYESTVICEYLEEVYPGNKGSAGSGSARSSLLPTGSAYEKARCRIWIDHINSKIVPAFYRFMQHTPEKAYTLEDAREEFLRHIKTIVRESMVSVAKAGPWFLGGTFSMVDVMLAPWICRLFLFDVYKKGGLGVPPEGEGGADEEVWVRWRIWVDAILNRESVRDTLSDPEMYVEAYKRYAEDTTQSEVAKATRLGRNMP
ncbi:hypothetical protein B0A52_02585 [Exophiala mesophila]|uniref:GST N-terminal domain-containing protein n=1 Tax=Exophiala mesophila TaxID=212818 RepID=A0A438NDG0_EXOME|nr:hypothetical protein B0A52_02585 [Exophiala mesophila]